ncbi:MAG: tRNA (adenosine(37)-N6)-dimethylallyltransferase MiaA [Planctomycetota bacterium]|nr:tRNA (adenosine(37)-N6)-dimethylallyltransferase MiaA [Planctomycetota bacterium]MDP6955194.1 tRNA (adenosine(37)-N6)-dimethylallyltransferase MiaA [Planctomycetota bacterium]
MSRPSEETRSRAASCDPLDAAPLRCLVGPTASGKTALALALAERAGAVVLSLDSMLVYRGLDIGTAKPSAAELARVPHRLIDLVEPTEAYDVQRYLADARAALGDLAGGRAMFVGGTGMYLMALVHGLLNGPPTDAELRGTLEAEVRERGGEELHRELAEVDPEAARRIHPNDTKRLVRALEVYRATGETLTSWQGQWPAADGGGELAGRPSHIIHLDRPDGELDQRIAARTDAMLAGGWVEEAVGLRAAPGLGPTSSQALGYREVLDLADGLATEEQTRELIVRRTRRFSRRQRTWYRRFPGRCQLTASGVGEPSEEIIAQGLAALDWA